MHCVYLVDASECSTATAAAAGVEMIIAHAIKCCCRCSDEVAEEDGKSVVWKAFALTGP